MADTLIEKIEALPDGGTCIYFLTDDLKSLAAALKLAMEGLERWPCNVCGGSGEGDQISRTKNLPCPDCEAPKHLHRIAQQTLSAITKTLEGKE